jgi:hypothetical protein
MSSYQCHVGGESFSTDPTVDAVARSRVCQAASVEGFLVNISEDFAALGVSLTSTRRKASLRCLDAGASPESTGHHIATIDRLDCAESDGCVDCVPVLHASISHPHRSHPFCRIEVWISRLVLHAIHNLGPWASREHPAIRPWPISDLASLAEMLSLVTLVISQTSLVESRVPWRRIQP